MRLIARKQPWLDLTGPQGLTQQGRSLATAVIDPLLLSQCCGVLVMCPQYYPSYGIRLAMNYAHLSLSLTGPS